MREGASDFFIKEVENKGFLAGIESALDKNGLGLVVRSSSSNEGPV